MGGNKSTQVNSAVGAKRLNPIDVGIVVSLILLLALVVFIMSGGGAGKIESADTNGDGKVTLADYADKKVGTITGVDYDDIIEKSLPDAEICYYDNYPDLVVALKTGLIDAFIIDEPALYPIMRQDPSIGRVPEDLWPWQMSFIFSLRDSQNVLCAQMNKFIEESKENGVLQEIEDIWISGEDEDKKVIPPLEDLPGEAGVIKVALETTYEPIVYIKDQRIVGYEIDILYRFCQKYHYGLDIDDMTFDAVLPAVISGKYDIGASGFEYNDEHRQAVAMSEPYYSTGTFLAVRASDLGVEEESSEDKGIEALIFAFNRSFQKNFLIEDRWQLVLKGIGTTCLITFLSVLAGSLIGFLLCMLRRTDSTLANPVCDAYVGFMQGIPLVVFLMILFYVVFGHSQLDAVWVAIIGFSLSFGASASEIIKSGLDSVDKGQLEAALALGYTDTQAFFRFLLPQAAVRFLPLYCIEIIILLNDTSIVGYIAVQDVTKMSDIIRSRSYEAAFPLIISTLIYFLLARVIAILMKGLLERIKPKRVKAPEGGDAG